MVKRREDADQRRHVKYMSEYVKEMGLDCKDAKSVAESHTKWRNLVTKSVTPVLPPGEPVWVQVAVSNPC